MAKHISLAGGALCACLALAGCVTEPGKTGPALWTTVDTQSEESKVRLKNPVRLHATYGRMAEANGRRKVARKHYETALSHDPKCVDALVGIARIDQFDGRAPQAEAGFQKALQVAPKDADVLQSAGLFYSSQGRWREAVASLNAAVAAAPNVAKHRYALAVVLVKSGDVNAAMPHLIATVGRAEAHSQIARFLLDRGDREGAEQQVRMALSVQPNLDSARQTLAQLHGVDPRRAVVAADSRMPQRGAVRSASHVAPANGLGSQSAWRRDVPQHTAQRPYAQQPLPAQFHDRRQERYPGALQIVPKGSRPQQHGTEIQPAGHSDDDRFRSPTPLDQRANSDHSRNTIPQWDPNGGNR